MSMIFGTRRGAGCLVFFFVRQRNPSVRGDGLLLSVLFVFIICSWFACNIGIGADRSELNALLIIARLGMVVFVPT